MATFRPTAVWKWDGSTTSNLTSNVNTDTDFNFIAASTDYIYIGSSKRFVGLQVDLTTNGSYTSLSWEYRNGDGWTALSLIDSYAWSASKYMRWNLPEDWIKFNFTSTDPHAYAPPDTVERYWIRIYCSAVTTTAVIDKLRIIPFVSYTTPQKVARFLQIKKDFDSSTKPTDSDIEDLIRRAEDRIDYMTYKSFRFNVGENEIVPYNRYGVFTRRRDLYKVYSVSIWNGSSWEALTEGRSSDYFVDYDRGMIYFTRLFLLPAAYGMTGRYYHWGYGEYAYSCQIDYAYGRDPEKHPEFRIAEEIATKMAAADLLANADYSTFVVSGTDKVMLESKIRKLNEDIENRLSEMTGVTVW